MAWPPPWRALRHTRAWRLLRRRGHWSRRSLCSIHPCSTSHLLIAQHSALQLPEWLGVGIPARLCFVLTDLRSGGQSMVQLARLEY
jgi:hypothetical protein